MVTINKDSFTITVQCNGGYSEENYIATFNQLIDSLQAENNDMRGDRYYYLELLRAMLPESEVLRDMLETDKMKVSKN